MYIDNIIDNSRGCCSIQSPHGHNTISIIVLNKLKMGLEVSI